MIGVVRTVHALAGHGRQGDALLSSPCWRDLGALSLWTSCESPTADPRELASDAKQVPDVSIDGPPVLGRPTLGRPR
jgi:hypothetical protein